MALERAVQKDSFERSFAQREIAEINGAQVETVDVKPCSPTGKTDVLLAGAWACTIPVYKPAMRELVKEGRRVIGLNHPREGGNIDLNPEEQELLKDYPEEQKRKALTLIGTLEYKNVDAIDIMAHSEAAGAAVIATYLLIKRAEKTGKPVPIHNLELCGPAGLIGKDNLLRLGYGFALQDSGIDPRAPSLRGVRVG